MSVLDELEAVAADLSDVVDTLDAARVEAVRRANEPARRELLHAMADAISARHLSILALQALREPR
jgi:hypothetical protein